MFGDLYNWEDDRWKEMKANSKVLCKSCVAMLSVGVEGHLSRLLPDESPWGGNKRKGEGAQQTTKLTI